MIYLETGSTDPYYNLAFEEYYLTHAGDEDILILWQNDNTVVIGLNQNAPEEINQEYVRSHNVNVVRRMTGGGAVYHDLGNLNYSFITKLSEYEEFTVNPFMEAVCRALSGFGLNAEPAGRNDITIEGKKISGTAQRIFHDHILHHGTLLFAPDTKVISEVLTPSPLKYSSVSTKSVRARVGSISEWLNEKITADDFRKRIRESLAGSAVRHYPDDKVIKAVNELADAKYRTWEWNFGGSPEYTVSGSKKFPGGVMEFRAKITEGRIEDIHFYGDYLAVKEDTDVRRRLKGIRFLPGELSCALSDDLEGVFGSISKKEVMELLLGS